MPPASRGGGAGEMVKLDGVGMGTKGVCGAGEGVGASSKVHRCKGEGAAQERGFRGLRCEGKRGHSNFIIDFLLRL